MLKSHSVYETDAVRANCAPFQPGLVSLPDSVSGAPSILDVLPASGLYLLEEQGERMMTAEAPLEEELPTAYWDPSLKGSRYLNFSRCSTSAGC